MSAEGRAPSKVEAETALTLPLPPHRIERDSEGYGRVVCEGEPLSRCRLICAEDCGAEWWPCGGDDDPTVDETYHRMRDGGYCHVVEYLSNDLAGLCADDQSPVAHTYAGPISVEWDSGDETYIWEPLNASAEVSS